MINKGEILASILIKFENCYFFLHNTKEFNVVESIINEGFIFESQLTNSCDRVNPDESIEVTYFLSLRKEYGPYTIIIAIPKAIYDVYSEVSIKNDVGIEDVLTIVFPYYGDNDELMYTLSPKHILGYFNLKTTEFFQNKSWDPFFDNSLVISQDNKKVSGHGNK